MNEFQDIHVELDGSLCSVRESMEQGPSGRKTLSSRIRRIITRINNGRDFGEGLAEQWTDRLMLLVRGNEDKLSNPYADMRRFTASPITGNRAYSETIPSVRILKSIPDDVLTESDPDTFFILKKSLLVLAVGGADSTFYGNLAEKEADELEKTLFSESNFALFRSDRESVRLPRAFASKKYASNQWVSILESIVLQAYKAGIRNIAAIANTENSAPIGKFFEIKFGGLKDLHWTVSIQPLLPVIRSISSDGIWKVSPEHGSYPGGHGQGFQFCMKDPEVKRVIDSQQLQYFIFTNGDNLVLFNWGASHLAQAIREVEAMKTKREFEKLRIGFLLVWEHIRKGGFAYVLKDAETKAVHTRIIEAELAGNCIRLDPEQAENRTAYNTNVGFGIIRDVEKKIDTLPLSLKMKFKQGVFESSLATALTTFQKEDGSSVFDPHAAVFFLPPKTARFPHWSHISIRKRGDLLAFFSSLFKIRKIQTTFGEVPLIVTDRNARTPFPELEGSILDPNILNTKEFVDIFKDSDLNLDAFNGSLKIDLLSDESKSNGRIRFKGKIQLNGSGEIRLTVPAGENWTLSDQIIQAPADENKLMIEKLNRQSNT